MNTLFLIPARGGSKGLPGKNAKELANKPLLCYAIDVARSITTDEHICMSSDDSDIIKVAQDYQLSVPFTRPEHLASDDAGSWEVILHALDHYASKGINYEAVVLLQPTSPLRQSNHVKEAIALFSDDLDMVVSVVEASANPYYSLYEENELGFLKKSKEGSTIERRQDAPSVWETNGAIYVINVNSLNKYTQFSDLVKLKKYSMEKRYSVDIDDILDFKFCELLIEENIVKLV